MYASTSQASPRFDRNSASGIDVGFNGALDLLRAWRDGRTPDPELTVSRWADSHRLLSPRGANEAGRWRTSRTPYLREIMDALSPMHPAQRIVVMKGAQIGATEAGNNWIGYAIHHAPGPMLAVQPTVELAKRFSQQRIDPLIDESPVLREKVAPARARDSGNTVLSKEFPGGILVMTGANSAVGLRSMPVRYLFLDEVDAYPASADEEGEPVALAEARTRTFSWRRKVFLVSTPTVKGLSRIEREFEASDQRRFFLPCPLCGAAQWLRFERLRWEWGNPATVGYVCEACDGSFGEHHKTRMLAEGEWRATAAAADPGIVGFHISALYSPLGWYSWEQIARDWEACQGNDEAKRSFKNTVLGETWFEPGEAPDWQRLYDRREDWRLGTVPMGGLILTAGADVQKDRIEVSVWAWGRGLESWLIDHIIIDGSPAEPDTWSALSELLAQVWRHESGAYLFQMDQYMDAQVERQKTAALFVGFVIQAEPDAALLGETAQDDGSGLAALQPALFQKLLPGEDVRFSQPPGVGQDFELFCYRVGLELAAAVGIPYSVLTGDLRQASYGSQRAGLVQFRRRMEQLQHGVFVYQLCRPVWQRWLADAVLSGALDLPDFAADPRRWWPAKWIPPRWEWIDPLKDLQAEKLAVDAGFKARSDVVEAMGYDAEETDARIAADHAREVALGLAIAPGVGETQGARATPMQTDEPAGDQPAQP